MNFIRNASAASAYKGYNYYKESNVISINPRDDDTYDGRVRGSEGKIYDVFFKRSINA